MARGGAQTLSDIHGASLKFVCEPCKRKGRYSIVRLKAKHGDAALPDLAALFAADCPKRASFRIYDRCVNSMKHKFFFRDEIIRQDIDTLKRRLRANIGGYTVAIRDLPAGTLLYRGVR
jgi:hypothetical protein